MRRTLTIKFISQFPIGIDSDRFIRALELPQVRNDIQQLKERFAGRKVDVCSLLVPFDD